MDAMKNPPGAVGGTQTTNFRGNSATSRLNMQDPVESFRQAMAGFGIEPVGKIIGDGRLHRCRVAGDKAGTTNGYFVLHLDPPASGIFGSWRLGIKEKWCSLSRDRLTAADWETIQRRTEVARLERQQEEEKRHRAARKRALWAWKAAVHVQGTGHPYLRRKAVLSHDLRVGPWQSGRLTIENCLLIPMADWSGELWSLQAIFPTKNETLGRDKDFLSGGRKTGLFHTLGKVDQTGTLLVCEGYATGATLHETTGNPVLVAFDAGNLLPVATGARRRYPAVDLVIACDNDRHTPGNPGLTKGRAAALASGARLMVPTFSDDEAGSDWNDWHLLRKGAANV